MCHIIIFIKLNNVIERDQRPCIYEAILFYLKLYETIVDYITYCNNQKEVIA